MFAKLSKSLKIFAYASLFAILVFSAIFVVIGAISLISNDYTVDEFPPVEQLQNVKEFINYSELKVGQIGCGLTTIKGTTVERFLVFYEGTMYFEKPNEK